MKNVLKSSKLTKSHLAYERALSLRENHSRSISVGILKLKKILLSGICPDVHVNEIHLPHDSCHKVPSFIKFHQNSQKYVKYEVYENV